MSPKPSRVEVAARELTENPVSLSPRRARDDGPWYRCRCRRPPVTLARLMNGTPLTVVRRPARLSRRRRDRPPRRCWKRCGGTDQEIVDVSRGTVDVAAVGDRKARLVTGGRSGEEITCVRGL